MRRTGFAALLLLTALWCLGPLLWQAVTSVKPAGELGSLPPVFPRHPTAVHYVSIFRGHPFLHFLANSLIVAAATTLLALAAGVPAAFALARGRIRARGIILGLVLGASMFPPIATVSPLYLIVRGLGLRDTLAALILTYTSFSLPLTIWVLANFFREIPREIVLASRVDGCTAMQSLIRVVLPLAAPGLTATAILLFIFSWNEFLFALTFTATPAARTVPVGIALFPGLHEVPWGEIAAASVVVTVPLVLLVFVFQRRIVEGLTRGAVKG
jgi:multiple sugar transport system permease protein